jgi:hypothetical protein
MRHSRAPFSEPAASCHVRSWVDFITTMFESEFLVHTTVKHSAGGQFVTHVAALPGNPYDTPTVALHAGGCTAHPAAGPLGPWG